MFVPLPNIANAPTRSSSPMDIDANAAQAGSAIGGTAGRVCELQAL